VWRVSSQPRFPPPRASDFLRVITI